MPKFRDLTNEVFGRLLVLERDSTCTKYVKWVCECECGNIKSIRSCHLVSKSIQSCGCLLAETTTERNHVTKTKHGMRNTRLYNIWRGMKQRCYDPNCSDYLYYGKKGIHICDEWKDDFQTFYAWSVNNGYSNNLTIDRKDNEGNYCPENCRWVTIREQNYNRSISKVYTVNGETHTLLEWSEILHIKYAQLHYKLFYKKGNSNPENEIRQILEEEKHD